MNDTKILQLLEKLIEGQQETNKQLDSLTTEVLHIKTAIKTVATKGDVDTTVDAAKSEIKSDILALNAKLVRKVQNHECRIENLEEHTDIPNPHKH